MRKAGSMFNKKKQATLLAKMNKLFEQKETKVGIAVLALAVLVLSFFSTQAVIKLAQYMGNRSAREKIAAEELISPIPSVTIVVSPVPTATPSAKVMAETNAQKLKAVKQLSFTSSETEVVVRKGDTFWSIASRVCGKGSLAEQLRRQTGHTRSWIQPGEVLTISCE